MNNEIPKHQLTEAWSYCRNIDDERNAHELNAWRTAFGISGPKVPKVG